MHFLLLLLRRSGVQAFRSELAKDEHEHKQEHEPSPERLNA
jgi:hypothetical protein